MKSNLGRETLITSETKDLVQQLQSKVSSKQCRHDDECVLFTGYKVSKSYYDSSKKKQLKWLAKASKFRRESFRKFIKKSWLEEFTNLSVPTLHNIKATKATHTYKSGHTELVVRKYLRHEDIRTTQLYIDLKNQKYIERLASGQVYNPLNNMGPSSHNFPASTELSIQINEPTMRSSAPNQHWRNRRRRKAKGCLK